MKRSLLFWWIICGWFSPALSAQPAAASHFLVVVDTSFSMAPQKATLCDAVSNLVQSAFLNRIKPNDTLSVWTFNQDTDTQQFPTLTWDPQTTSTLAARAYAFLRDQPFQKISRLDSALPQMLELAKGSRKLLIFVLSDGFEFFQGTPFDTRINEVYRERSRELRQAGRPFITFLQAVNGQIVAWSVSAVGEPIAIPQLPPDNIASSQSVGSTPTEAPPSASTVTAQPKVQKQGAPKTNLIVRSVPTIADSQTATANDRAKIQNQLQSVEPDSSKLNFVPAPSPRLLSATPNPVALAKTNAPMVEAAASKTDPAKAPLTPAQRDEIQLEVSFQPPEPAARKNELPSAKPTPTKTLNESAVTPAQPQSNQSSAASPGDRAASLNSPPAVVTPQAQTALPDRMAVQTQTPTLKAATTTEPTASKTFVPLESSATPPARFLSGAQPIVKNAAHSQSPATSLLASRPASAQAVVVVPPAANQFRWGYFALGLASLLAAVGLVWMLVRRRPSPNPASIISRSIERK